MASFGRWSKPPRQSLALRLRLSMDAGRHPKPLIRTHKPSSSLKRIEVWKNNLWLDSLNQLQPTQIHFGTFSDVTGLIPISRINEWSVTTTVWMHFVTLSQMSHVSQSTRWQVIFRRPKSLVLRNVFPRISSSSSVVSSC